MTLDLREEFRDAVVDPFTAGYAAGETPNPCTALQRRVPFRRAAGLRVARGCREPVDRALRPDRRAGRAPARGPCGGPGQGSVVHALDPRSETPRACALPARRPDEGARPGRRPRGLAWRPRPGRRARRRASSPGATTGRSSSARGSARRAAPSSTRTAAALGTPRRLLALHTGTAPGARGRRRASAVRAPHRPRRERGRGRRRARSSR